MTPRDPVVHVVDDDPSLRRALVRLLQAAGYDVRAHASAGDFLIAHTEPGPGCIVLDVRMPGPSGLELQQALARQADALPIVFLTGHGDIPMSVRAVQAGAVDFLTKPVQRDDLLRAVQAAVARDRERRAASDQLRELRERFASLTPREREVALRVAGGALNKQIAFDTSCSIRTVKIYRQRAMLKMQAGSLAELVRMFEAIGMRG